MILVSELKKYRNTVYVCMYVCISDTYCTYHVRADPIFDACYYSFDGVSDLDTVPRLELKLFVARATATAQTCGGSSVNRWYQIIWEFYTQKTLSINLK